MIDSYLNFLHKDNKQLNEFIVLPVIIMATKIYKKYYNYKKISNHCISKDKIIRKKCFIKYKIKALIKTTNEIKQFKQVCKKWSKNVPKCINKVDKQLNRLQKDINKLKINLTKL